MISADRHDNQNQQMFSGRLSEIGINGGRVSSKWVGLVNIPYTKPDPKPTLLEVSGLLRYILGLSELQAVMAQLYRVGEL